MESPLPNLQRRVNRRRVNGGVSPTSGSPHMRNRVIRRINLDVDESSSHRPPLHTGGSQDTSGDEGRGGKGLPRLRVPTTIHRAVETVSPLYQRTTDLDGTGPQHGDLPVPSGKVTTIDAMPSDDEGESNEVEESKVAAVIKQERDLMVTTVKGSHMDKALRCRCLMLKQLSSLL